jgi:hypothetical protein
MQRHNTGIRYKYEIPQEKKNTTVQIRCNPEHTIIQAKISVPSKIGTSCFALKKHASNKTATELTVPASPHRNRRNENQVNSETLAQRHLPPRPTQQLRTGEFTRNTAKGSTEQTRAPSTGHRLEI